MKKRIIALFMASVMAFTIIGCGSKSDDNAKEAEALLAEIEELKAENAELKNEEEKTVEEKVDVTDDSESDVEEVEEPAEDNSGDPWGTKRPVSAIMTNEGSGESYDGTFESEEENLVSISEKPLTSLESIEYDERENLNTFYNGVACVAVGGRRYLIDKDGVARCDVNKITEGTLRNILIAPVDYTGLWVAYDSSRKFVLFDSDGNEKYRNEDENCRFLGAADDCIFYAKLESGFDESRVSVIKIDTAINESEVAIFVDSEGDAIDSLNIIDKKSKQACIFHKLDDGVYYEDKMGFINENTKTAFSHRDYYYVGINSKNMYVFVEDGLDSIYECMPVSSDLKSVKCGDDVDALIYNESNQNWGDFYKARRVDNGYVGFNLYEHEVFSMDGKKITLPVEIDEGTSFTQYKDDRMGIGCLGQDYNSYLLVVDGQGNRVCEPIQTEYILYQMANINGFIIGVGNDLIGVTQDGKVIGIEDGFPIDDNYRCNSLGIAEGFIWHDASKSFVSYDGKTVINKIIIEE